MNKEQIRHLLNFITTTMKLGSVTDTARLRTAEQTIIGITSVLESHLLSTDDYVRYYPPAEPYHEKEPFTYNDFKLTCDMVNEAAGLATARSGNTEDND